jgi:thiopurine S-methyltransferase
MDREFWQKKWEKNEIAFHQREPNPLLVHHFDELALPDGSRLFLPLCGKTLDIHWLLARGHRVAGAELSQLAIDQLFAELGVKPTVAKVGALDCYSAPNIDVFVGDFFALAREQLGPVDAVYDRAALVALPAPMRARYVMHLVALTNRAPQLLIAYVYDQSLVDGPPFSVSDMEVRRHYDHHYGLHRLAAVDVAGGLKGRFPASEHVWLMTPRAA